ncbi:MAG: MgtC/SapB family protein [Erysipelotrichaceae bacterium]|nr:MgtC/SapB family protein [Erysipelotrichaceae bacterium]
MTDSVAAFLGPWSVSLNLYSILFRIMMAIIFSAIIGWERSSKRHSAGLRTFMLVALAGCFSVMIDQVLSDKFYLITAATIVAVSSLSSNSLFISSRNQIKGLTTSAALWISAIMGMSVGAGYYALSLFIFIAIMVSLSFFPKLEKFLKDRSNHFEVHLELIDSKYLQNFVTTIRELGLTIDDIEFNPAYRQSGLSVYSIAISISNNLLKQYKTHEEIIEALKTLDYIYHIEEIQ